MTIGSTLFGAMPMLWGDGGFSFSSIVLTAVGGFAGIYVGYKISN